jgi:hypothetical protein
MSALVRTLLRLLPAGLAARLRFGRLSVDPVSRPAAGHWECLELAGPAEPGLRTARELVVGRPDDLTLDVLAAAPELAAVVLPPQGWLPRAIVAELARRGIATVWRLPTADPRPPRRTAAARSPVSAGCTVSRRRSGS